MRLKQVVYLCQIKKPDFTNHVYREDFNLKFFLKGGMNHESTTDFITGTLLLFFIWY